MLYSDFGKILFNLIPHMELVILFKFLPTFWALLSQNFEIPKAAHYIQILVKLALM